MMRIVVGHLMARPAVLVANAGSVLCVVVGILERWMFMLYRVCRHTVRHRTHCHVQNMRLKNASNIPKVRRRTHCHVQNMVGTFW